MTGNEYENHRGFSHPGAYWLWHLGLLAAPIPLYLDQTGIRPIPDAWQWAAGILAFCTLLSFTLEWYAGFAFEQDDMGRFHTVALTLMLTPALVFRLIMIAMRDPAGSVFWTATLALTGLIAWQAYTVWTDQFR